MQNVIFTADAHIGVTGRLRDILWSLETISLYAMKHNIEVIVLLGDLFHDRTAIDIECMCAAYEFFQRTRKRGQKWVVFVGNHDMFLKHSWDINSLKPFKSTIDIIDSIKLLMLGDARFWVLPFIHFETAYMKVLSTIEDKQEDGDVLLTHIGTTGAIRNSCFLLKDWTVVNLSESKFKRVFTGHFHTCQQVGNNVWYPGSPIPFKADEGDCEHGFIVYNTADQTQKFVNIWKVGSQLQPGEIPPPNYLTITPQSIQDMTKADIANNIVRVMVTHESDLERKAISEKLNDLQVKEVRWRDTEEQAPTAIAMMAEIAEHDYFDEWLKADIANLDGFNVKLLTKLHKHVKQTGDERYEAIRQA